MLLSRLVSPSRLSQSLRSNWGQLIAAINRAINETQNQILIRDSAGLTEEQLAEYRKSFNHFDRVGHLKMASFGGQGGPWKLCAPPLGDFSK